MAQLFTNVARSTLSASLADTDLSFSIASGGALFPVANTGAVAITDQADWFKVTLQNGANYEIVYVRTHTASSNSFTDVMRGQEGTAAQNFPSGAVVGIRVTAGDMTSAINSTNLAQIHAAILSF